MFICHGNICRSPMAEFVFKDMVKKNNLEDEFYICSSATSTEALGQGVHRGTKQKLSEYNILTKGKYSVQLDSSDYYKFDYLLVMDSLNLRNIRYIIPTDEDNKIYKLLDFTNRKGDIADPWYTGNFDETYDDIYEGCQAFLDYVMKNDINEEATV